MDSAAPPEKPSREAGSGIKMMLDSCHRASRSNKQAAGPDRLARRFHPYDLGVWARAAAVARSPARSGAVRCAVVYFGSGEFAVPALRWLINSPHEIAAVVSQPDRPAGRGKKPMPTPVAQIANANHLTVHKVADANDAEIIAQIGSLQADLGNRRGLRPEARCSAAGGVRGRVHQHSRLAASQVSRAPDQLGDSQRRAQDRRERLSARRSDGRRARADPAGDNDRVDGDGRRTARSPGGIACDALGQR